MRRLLRVEVLAPVTAVGAFLLIYGLLGAAPSGNTARWAGLGALLAPALMVYAHRGAAALAAVLGAVLWTPLNGGAALIVWAYAGLVLMIARLDRPAPAEPMPHRMPPAPAALPRVSVPAEVLGYALLASAAGGLAYVGSHDEATRWMAAVLAAGGLGAALVARAARHRRALRRLFAGEQPVHAVRVVEQLCYVHVLLPLPDGRTAWEFGIDIAELDQPPADDVDEPHTVAALLYGEPRVGGWCALEVGGRLHVPLGPVAEVITVPYDVVQALPREIEDDEEQLVDPEALRPGDRDVAAAQAREHRISPQRAWVATVGIGLGAALVAAELVRLAGDPPTVVLTAVVTVVAAIGYEYGWRSQLRPRLRWHAGGVAAVGFGGPHRQPWATDSAVLHDDEGTVVLTAGEEVLTVPVPPPWPSAQAQRSASQLVAALRDARTQSFEVSPLPPPPEIDVPRRPGLLYPAWMLSVALSVLLIG
ncbi:hypothetical protein ACWKSP_30530 [Micromonosporaceae bacterium Da 78-11]